MMLGLLDHVCECDETLFSARCNFQSFAFVRFLQKKIMEYGEVGLEFPGIAFFTVEIERSALGSKFQKFSLAWLVRDQGFEMDKQFLITLIAQAHKREEAMQIG